MDGELWARWGRVGLGFGFVADLSPAALYASLETGVKAVEQWSKAKKSS